MSAAPPDAIESLRAENERLRARLDHMERVFLGTDLVCPVAWGLTASEQRVLAVLLKRTFVSKAQLALALSRDETHDVDSILVQSHLSRLRRKMRPHGLVVTNERFVGYRVPPAIRASLMALMEEERHADAA